MTFSLDLKCVVRQLKTFEDGLNVSVKCNLHIVFYVVFIENIFDISTKIWDH